MSIYAIKRSVWLDRVGNFGSFPPYAALKARDVELIYFSPEDPAVTAGRLAEARGKGFAAGIASVPRVGDPVQYAGVLEADIKRLDPVGGQAPVLVDIELHDARWILAWLAAYRGLRPGRATDFTCEPYQDGRWGGTGPSVYQDLIDSRMDIFPQTYLGDMTPADPMRVIRTIVAEGVPLERLHLVYDGAARPSGVQDGCAFTCERLLL